MLNTPAGFVIAPSHFLAHITSCVSQLGGAIKLD